MRSDLLKALWLVLAVTPVICKKNSDIPKLSKAINAFGDDIYEELAKESGNIVFSPFSVHSVLSLLTLGTGGRTQRELISILQLTDMSSLRTDYPRLRKPSPRSGSSWRNRSPLVANAIFYDERFPLCEYFKANASGTFEASPQKVDFAYPKQAAADINNWVSNKTNRAIKKMIEEQAIDDGTRLMLLNAIHFKGKWKLKFNKSETIKNHKFHTGKKDVKCNMMVLERQKHKLYVFRDFSMLELSFNVNDIKIAFVKPRPEKTMTEVEKSINGKSFFNHTTNLRTTPVHLKIPKFKLTTDLGLQPILTEIGLGDLFKGPDMSHLFKSATPAKVDDVRQKVVIDVNEEGATASVATSAQLSARSPPLFLNFILDGPFLFFLYDTKNQVILIRGRVVNPLELNS